MQIFKLEISFCEQKGKGRGEGEGNFCFVKFILKYKSEGRRRGEGGRGSGRIKKRSSRERNLRNEKVGKWEG